jgi:C1A family cysteine protease
MTSMPLLKGEPLIDDEFHDHDFLYLPKVDGSPKGRGAVPRDYKVQPQTMFASPTEIKLIPKSEWSARLKEKEETQSSLRYVRLQGNNGQPVPSLDQGQVGYCWAHSTTHAVMLDRMMRGMDYVPLSAYSIAAIIKKGKDEGGWGALSAQFAKDNGIASQTLWPQGQRNYSQLDTPACRADMKLRRIDEDWTDLTKQVYDRTLTFDMLASLLLSDIPGPVDFNWWGHSVCAMELVEVEAGSFGIRIWNSWGDGWGEKGMGVLRGNKAIPDGAVSIRTTTAANAA